MDTLNLPCIERERKKEREKKEKKEEEGKPDNFDMSSLEFGRTCTLWSKFTGVLSLEIKQRVGTVINGGVRKGE